MSFVFEFFLLMRNKKPGKKLGFSCFNRRKFYFTFQNRDSTPLLKVGVFCQIGGKDMYVCAKVSVLGSEICWLMNMF